jgi:serine/threonine protein kinase
MILIFEYMPGGDLRTYLRGLRQRDGGFIGPELYNSLCGAVVQIAGAMEYLESRFVVHRDLAARNVLVGDGLDNIKLSDFGLSRGVGLEEEYIMRSAAKLPLKWMAPEAIRDSVFTSKSDVWSFGILLWEIFNLARVPFSDVGNAKVYHVLQSGIRPHIPDICGHEMRELMTSCWAWSPLERPTFGAIYTQFMMRASSADVELEPEFGDLYPTTLCHGTDPDSDAWEMDPNQLR